MKKTLRKTFKKTLACLLAIAITIMTGPSATVMASWVDPELVNYCANVNMQSITVPGYSSTLFYQNPPKNFFMPNPHSIYISCYFDIDSNGIQDLGVFKFNIESNGDTYHTGDYYIVKNCGESDTLDFFVHNEELYLVFLTSTISVGFARINPSDFKVIKNNTEVTNVTNFNHSIMTGGDKETNTVIGGPVSTVLSKAYRVENIKVAVYSQWGKNKIEFLVDYSILGNRIRHQYSRYDLSIMLSFMNIEGLSYSMGSMPGRECSSMFSDGSAIHEGFVGMELSRNSKYIYTAMKDEFDDHLTIYRESEGGLAKGSIDIYTATDPTEKSGYIELEDYRMIGLNVSNNNIYFGIYRAKGFVKIYSLYEYILSEDLYTRLEIITITKKPR